METFKDILWPIIVLGGFGAFIDFLIGKAGQQKTKDFLLKWWVRFDDVRWNNFGREEGLFAGRLMERWFGKRIWSPRRIFVAFALFNLLLLAQYLRGLLSSEPVWCLYCGGQYLYGPVALFTSFIGFCASISFTKFVAFRMADLCDISEVKNFNHIICHVNC